MFSLNPFKIRLKAPKILLVDFHGTIAPTLPIVCRAFVETITAEHPVTPGKRKLLSRYYMESAGTPLEEQAIEGLKIADGREHSRQEGIEISGKMWQNVLKSRIKPYLGIGGGLKRLKKAGWRIFVSTDNPQEVADALVQRTGLRKYFDGVLGKDVNSREHKVITHTKKIAASLGIRAQDFGKHFVYLGDSLGEMENARRIGVNAVGRTTTRSARKMRKSGAKRIIPGKGLRAKLHFRAYLR